MKTGDIDGSSPRPVYVRKTKYDSHNYADITKAKFVSTRHTNPLEPSYVVRNKDDEVIQTQKIEGSAPKPLPTRNEAEKYS